MRKVRFTEEQMVAIVREADREPVAVVAKRHGISEQTIYVWRKRFGGLQSNDVRRLKQLEAENARLKKLVAERDLEIEVMKEVAAKNCERAGSSASSCVWPERGSLGTTGLHAVLGGAIGVALPGPHDGEGRGRDRADAGAVGGNIRAMAIAASVLSRPRRASHERRPGPTGSGARPACAAAQGHAARGGQEHGHARKRRRDRTRCGGMTCIRPLRQRAAAQVPSP